ncbi:uncharacterized protein LOC112560753 [Pomacea canaliculata]|uniref:uncharacterized protein LOC112560753 n=1 Tax=Pomacea canaliculata TaxID=400727 RepID=UPI000D72DD25|nr:uncharacterized protein LOC112560753 [Pomacea canaliculata]
MCVLSPVYSQMLRAVVAPPYPQAVCLAATVAGWATQCCVLAPARHGFCGVTKPRARALHAQGGDVSSLFSSYRVSSGGQPLSASFCLYFPVGLLFGSCEGRDFLLALPENGMLPPNLLCKADMQHNNDSSKVDGLAGKCFYLEVFGESEGE